MTGANGNGAHLDPVEVGARIAAAREAKGLSQVKFATEVAGVSPSTVSRWERGYLPPVDELVRVAQLLEIPTDKLLETPASLPGLWERLERIERLLEAVAAKVGVKP